MRYLRPIPRGLLPDDMLVFLPDGAGGRGESMLLFLIALPSRKRTGMSISSSGLIYVLHSISVRIFLSLFLYPRAQHDIRQVV